MTLCGAVLPVDGRQPLVCTLPIWHDGPHGVSGSHGAVYVRWV
jgi:hypothetical protein